MRIIGFTVLFVFVGACVDRLQFDVAKPSDYGVVVDGYISNEPGPYTINISKAFDIESKLSTKLPVSAKHIVLMDDLGRQEELREVKDGTFQTDSARMQGQVGRVYKVRIELRDGKVYESIPDTLLPAGRLDTLYYSLKSTVDISGQVENGFDIYVTSTQGENANNQFMWQMTGTYQAESRADLYGSSPKGCYPLPDGKCNFIPPCSGLMNIAGPSGPPQYERVAPCSCCTCWYNIYNSSVVLSDSRNSNGTFYGIYVDKIPITPWIFMHKIHVAVYQRSLSLRAFRFWRAIKEQYDAVNSLFQPISGKIPVNFIQLSGEEAPVQGLFYATAITSKGTFIDRQEVPHYDLLPTLDDFLKNNIGLGSCLEMFPNATNVKPSFWED